MSASDLPPELLIRIMELAVESIPPSLSIRSEILRNFSLVESSWRIPAQVLLESRVQLDSYSKAKMYMDRPRRLERKIILDELQIFFDFVSPEDDEFYPLTEWILRLFLERDIRVKSLHLRSALFMNAFDTSLLSLPSFRGEPAYNSFPCPSTHPMSILPLQLSTIDLRSLRLEMPIEPPSNATFLPISLSHLALSEMMDQPLELFSYLLANSQESLVSLHIFTIKGGSPLHQRVLEILPSLPRSLRHLSISSHWILLPETLLRLVASCDNLATVSLTGIDFSQVLHLAATIPSRLSAFDFTIPSSSRWTDEEVLATIDHLLRIPNFSHVREISIVQRLESKGGVSPSRLQEFRGQQMCKVTWERTLRKLFILLFSLLLVRTRADDSRSSFGDSQEGLYLEFSIELEPLPLVFSRFRLIAGQPCVS
jgi:hypothetical protein